jgi:hypothetical protein
MKIMDDETKTHWTNRLPKVSNHLKEKKKHDLMIGKNITLVLNNLLKNYQSSEPPNHGKGKWTMWTYTKTLPLSTD